jgi:signal transduction histidine kinase
MVQREGTSAASIVGAPGPRKIDARAGSTTAGFLPLFGEDVETTLERVASLVLPLRAEVCLLDLSGEVFGREAGLYEALARGAADGGDEVSAALRGRLDPHDPLGSPSATSRSWPRLVPQLAGDVLAGSAFGQQARARGFGALLAAPMRARGRLVGVVTLLAAEGAPGFDREDVAFVEALADHAALALLEALRRDELLRAVRTRDELLGTLALELRDPLATLAATLHRLFQRGAGDERERKGARRASLRIERLLEDAMALVRLRKGRVALRLVERAPSALVRDAVAEVASLLGERAVSVHAPAGAGEGAREPTLRCDAERTRHALSNLLGNAARWTAPNGRVAVEVETGRDEVVFRVRDDGPSIEPRELALSHARPPIAAMASRAGVSLAIARELAAAQGGRLWVDAPLGGGGGSALCLALPRD